MAFPGCPRFFSPRVTILAHAPNYLVSVISFILFQALVVISSLGLYSSFFFHFVCFTFIFIFCVNSLFRLFCFAILSLNVFRVADEVET